MSKAVAVVKKGDEDEYTIKPQATTPTIDTSSWPLLLKNYEKREFLPLFLPMIALMRCFFLLELVVF